MSLCPKLLIINIQAIGELANYRFQPELVIGFSGKER